MKKWVVSFVVLAAVLLTYGMVDFIVEPPGSRAPASVPTNYESMKACEKQDILWGKIQASAYKELPDFRPFGPLQLLAMSKQEVGIKAKNVSDFAPVGWKKYLHGRASIAKIKIVPAGGKYTGIFQGADCGLLRLSITFKPEGSRAVAPGLALKVLRDGIYSANISALVSLGGQEKEFNFFQNPMSNIVPMGAGLGQNLVHKIFLSATKYPEELQVRDMSEVDASGVTAKEVTTPRQLFFVPGPSLRFSSSEHDVRTDFASIQSGTLVYQIYALSDKYKNFDYANYNPESVSAFLKESEHIADIVSVSEFTASEFGDDGIFFRHQMRP